MPARGCDREAQIVLRRMNRLMLRPRPIAAAVVACAILGSSDVSSRLQHQTEAGRPTRRSLIIGFFAVMFPANAATQNCEPSSVALSLAGLSGAAASANAWSRCVRQQPLCPHAPAGFLRLKSELAISRADSTNRRTTGVRLRFLNVTMATGEGLVDSWMGRRLSA
jgi:hypothetical protein